MRNERLDLLNIGLMLLAALLALRWPFETLLLAYAVLGPLHYMTEISWLHERRYFLPARQDIMPVFLGGVLLVAGPVLGGFFLSQIVLQILSVALLLWLFGAALVLMLTSSRMHRVLACIAMLPVCLLLAYHAPAAAIFAIYLPTVIHVYVFTGLFMLTGWLRRPSRIGIAAVAVFAVLPLACVMLPAGLSAAATSWAAGSYGATFGSLNAIILQHAGHVMPSDQIVVAQTSILLTRVLAFIYLYHYLNWFSKTSVIGWTNMSRLRAIAITTAWLTAVGIYFYNYLLGFQILLTLSFMHVLLEFPLNHGTLRQLALYAVKR